MASRSLTTDELKKGQSSRNDKDASSISSAATVNSTPTCSPETPEKSILAKTKAPPQAATTVPGKDISSSHMTESRPSARSSSSSSMPSIAIKPPIPRARRRRSSSDRLTNSQHQHNNNDNNNSNNIRNDRRPTFLDRERFLARQVSDKFCIMNLLDPRTFYDDNDVVGQDVQREVSVETTEDHQESTRLSSLQESWHESSNAFPSVFQRSEYERSGILVDEVQHVLEALPKARDDEAPMIHETALMAESSRKDKKAKKDKKLKKERKEHKKDKKKKKDKDREGKKSKEGRTSGQDFFEPLTPSPQAAAKGEEQELPTMNASTVDATIEIITNDVSKSRRKDKKSSSRRAETNRIETFSQSFPGTIKDRKSRSKDSKRQRRLTQETGMRYKQETKPDSAANIAPDKIWNAPQASSEAIFSARPLALVQVTTTKLDASEFEESGAGNFWVDIAHDDTDDSAWDSCTTSLFSKPSKEISRKVGDLSIDARSSISHDNDSKPAISRLHESEPILTFSHMDESGHTSKTSESAQKSRRPPLPRPPRAGHPSIVSLNSSVSMPSVTQSMASTAASFQPAARIGLPAPSSVSVASSNSSTTGVSRSIADSRTSGTGGYQSSPSIRSRRPSGIATTRTVKSAGHMERQRGELAASTSSLPSTPPLTSRNRVGVSPRGILKLPSVDKLWPPVYSRDKERVDLSTPFDKMSTSETITTYVPPSRPRVSLPGTGFLGRAKARYTNRKTSF